MKKIIISLLLMVAPVALFAQLTVFSNGSNNVSIKTTAENPYAYLMVSPSTNTSYSGYNMGILSTINVVSSLYNMGVYGVVTSSSPLTSGCAYGVIGVAGNAFSGYNYGVFGRLSGNQNGAGVVGTTTTGQSFSIPGRYAGFFVGNTEVQGVMSATSYTNTSDIRLKENIDNFNDLEDGPTTLNKVGKMNVIAYNYKPQTFISDADKDTMSVEDLKMFEELSKIRHYGLSAQELQEIYPDLVYERQNGYLGINYVELVPVLIRSIQELKKEIDELKAKNNQTRGTNFVSDATSLNSAINEIGSSRNTYSLKGNLISNTAKGILIQNGRKQAVK